MDPRSWSVFKRQAGVVRVPYLDPAEARAQLEADAHRRRAEQQRDQALLQAELARHQALLDAGIEPVQPPSETTVERFIDTQF
jgi:hypothetical protein